MGSYYLIFLYVSSRNVGQSEDVVQKRQLKEITVIPAINFSIPSSPSHAPQVPIPPASAEPSRNSTFNRDDRSDSKIFR